MFGIGETELVIIVVFGFLLFGPDKLPGMGRTIGRALRQFREAQEDFTQVVQAEVMDPLNEAMNEPVKKAAKTASDDSDIEGSDSEVAARKAETFAERKARLQAERKAAEEAEKAQAAESKEADGGEKASGQVAEADNSAEAEAQETQEAAPEADAAPQEDSRPAANSVEALYSLTTPRHAKKSAEKDAPQVEDEQGDDASGKEDGSEA